MPAAPRPPRRSPRRPPLPPGAHELCQLALHDMPVEERATRLRAVLEIPDLDGAVLRAAADMLLRVQDMQRTVAVFEGVVPETGVGFGTGFWREDGGAAYLARVDAPQDPAAGEDEGHGLFVEVRSYDASVCDGLRREADPAAHTRFKRLLGHRVQVTIKVLD